MMLALGMFVFELRTLPYSRCSIRKIIAGCPMTGWVNHCLSVSWRGGNLYTACWYAIPAITGGWISLKAVEVMANEGERGR